LNGTWPWKRIRIYAPGKPFADVEPDQALHRLIHPPFYPVTLHDFPTPVEIISLKKEALKIGTLSIQLQAQNHPGGSMGIRIGNSLAYVTDTPVLQTTETFVRGVKLLLHETWLTDAEAETDEVECSRHSTVSAVTQLSKRAKVANVMPIHHHPRRSEAEIREIARDMEAQAGIHVFAPEEGRIWEVD
jgi:ribonuclease BN (tRNA processing enzyme)